MRALRGERVSFTGFRLHIDMLMRHMLWGERVSFASFRHAYAMRAAE